MSQLPRDHVPQRAAAWNDPALAVVFPGEVGYGYETSLGKAKMPIKLFIFSKQGNVMGNIIESDREYMVLPLQCILLKIMNTYEANWKGNTNPPKRRGRKRARGERR